MLVSLSNASKASAIWLISALSKKLCGGRRISTTPTWPSVLMPMSLKVALIVFSRVATIWLGGGYCPAHGTTSMGGVDTGGRQMSQSEHAPKTGGALVIGGGTMGVGIIAMFLAGGWKCDVVSRSASTRDGLAAAVTKALVAMGKPATTSGLATYATL